MSLAKQAASSKAKKYARRGLFIGSAAALAAEMNRRGGDDSVGPITIAALPFAGYGYGKLLGRIRDKHVETAYEKMLREEGYIR